MTWLGLGILVQILADAVVGVRLLMLARRTRKLPEAAFGGTCLLLGVLGLPISIAARNGLAATPEQAGWLLAVGLGFQNLASLLLYVGTWRVFRRETGWAGALVATAALALTASLVGHGLTVGFRGGVDHGLWYEVGFATRAAAFLWTAGESFGYSRTLRRRLTLGLADPVVAERFRLWFWCNSGIALGFFAFLVARLLGENPAATPWVLATTSVVGIASGTALWLAFAPPAAYLRRVRRRSVPTYG